MNAPIKLSKLLYGISIIGISICSLVITYLMIMAVLAVFGTLPKYHDVSIEVPISLDESSNYFSPKSLDERYYIKRIDVKKANLDILPKKGTYLNSFGYLHASLYVSFFLLILIFLGRILKKVGSGNPFHPRNSIYLKFMGLLSLGLGIYEFLTLLLASQVFSDKFTLNHGHTITSPSIWDLNIVALFLGLVLLVLSNVFQNGSDLQDLEAQTV